MLALPEMMGTPSSLGRGIVSAMPTFVPTQRSPFAAERHVTWMDLLLLDTPLSSRTLLTLLAMLIS